MPVISATLFFIGVNYLKLIIASRLFMRLNPTSYFLIEYFEYTKTNLGMSKLV